MSACFDLLRLDASGTQARRGALRTRRGVVQTPAFMVVGTRATVRGLTPAQLKEAGAGILLGNAYHLEIRPGAERVERLGGLHRFMGWDGPILTDSGGFQVFSLSDRVKITEDGVHFRSHVDGAPLFLGPAESMRIQQQLDSDIHMVFDECSPYPCTREEAQAGMERTLRWARRCRDLHPGQGRLLFAIGQGSVYEDLRERCIDELVRIGFDGYAVGGVSVGEGTDWMRKIVSFSAPRLPQDKPRYLMGVGKPEDILTSVAAGIDLFDCVMPTRNGRNALTFTFDGEVRLRNAVHKDDGRPLEEGCDCYACKSFSRAYLHHLFRTEELLALVLASLHNVRFFLRLMAGIRDAIDAGSYAAYQERFWERYTASRRIERDPR